MSVAQTRSIPLSYLTDAAVGTGGTAFLLPTTKRPRRVRISTSAAAFVGSGTAASPPAAAVTNTVYQAAGTQDYTLDDQGIPYFYVYSTTSTIVAFVSFLG